MARTGTDAARGQPGRTFAGRIPAIGWQAAAGRMPGGRDRITPTAVQNGDEDRTPLPTGTWRVRISADGVARYTGPAPIHGLTVGQVRFEPGGGLVVGSQIPGFLHAPGGGFCGDTVGDGTYHWSLHGHVLTVQVVSDHQCASRNSFWNGTFTR
jgi:hypothetical protein